MLLLRFFYGAPTLAKQIYVTKNKQWIKQFPQPWRCQSETEI